MLLTPWKKRKENGANWFSPVMELRSEMDRLFDSFLREPFAGLTTRTGELEAWAPVVDLAETDKELTVRAELPGVTPKDIDVSIHGEMLVIAGEKKEQTEKQEKNFHLVESRYGSFRREIGLPVTVDPEKVTAEFADGILTVKLVKTEPTPTKKIDVKTT